MFENKVNTTYSNICGCLGMICLGQMQWIFKRFIYLILNNAVHQALNSHWKQAMRKVVTEHYTQNGKEIISLHYLHFTQREAVSALTCLIFMFSVELRNWIIGYFHCREILWSGDIGEFLILNKECLGKLVAVSNDRKAVIPKRINWIDQYNWSQQMHERCTAGAQLR